MSIARRLPVALMTLVALTACGRTAGMAPISAARMSTGAPVVMDHGVERKLGFNMALYKSKYAPTAQPVHLARQALLPSSVDNRASCPPVYDQGQLGSCTGFAIAKGLREFIQRTGGEAQVPLSAQFLYYEERVIENTVSEDSGATLTDGLTVLKDTGVATEALCPYDIANFINKPSDAAFAEAGDNKTHHNTQVSGLDDIKTVVAKGGAVAIGFTVYSSFMKIGKDGIMPMPKKSEKQVGGHAVLIVGYDDAKKAVLVRNSWSATWGLDGYFYMPYAYVSDTKLADDFWTAD